MTAPARPVLLRPPELGPTMDRYVILQREHQAAARRMWIGTLICSFTNDELRLLAPYFSMADTFAFREFGLIGTDEGFDGKTRR